MKGCPNDSRHRDKFLCQKKWKNLKRTSYKHVQNVNNSLNEFGVELNSQKAILIYYS
ncbi:hypothetical protein LCGC14_0985940 [marine sediment metagenome]|uniref:Uncharacterized protein n=1 Tax=marine sediment metagenome TaxID=412755 RepID=A0A0F9N779_9ZZZZ